ncbi:MAG: 50S ribosomal protein L16 [Patescibacteria group bacterium]
MLEPKKIKRRKPHDPFTGGRTNRNTEVSFGDFGLKAMSSGWITNRAIEAGRRSIIRFLKKGGKMWIRIFPDRIVTAGSNVTPMGGGKGGPDRIVAGVRAGSMLFEIAGIPEDQAKRALELASHKLCVRTKIVEKEGR